jgi:hypothetical protein
MKPASDEKREGSRTHQEPYRRWALEGGGDVRDSDTKQGTYIAHMGLTPHKKPLIQKS